MAARNIKGKPRHRRGGNKRPIEQYEHKDKERLNNPPVGLVTPQTDPDTAGTTGLQSRRYAYDPHLDPQLVWAGKAERTSFEVPTVSLHVHERIDPRTIIEAVRKRNGRSYEQMSLFASRDENPPLRDAIEFYKHKHNWSNRLIAGDSLLVMNSLIEKEGLAGQVQLIYIDPPYGIKYGSNFQPFVNKRDVKDGKDEDLTAEPEMIKAFRDTWELGIHSYLTYLRDRLLLARELLTESGSIFVQISDENVHRVRDLMDEVFGPRNSVGIIVFRKKGMTLGAKYIETMNDYIVWYAKSKQHTKVRTLFEELSFEPDSRWDMIELADGTRRKITEEERELGRFPEGARLFDLFPIVGQGASPGGSFPIKLDGREYYPKSDGHWITTELNIARLIELNRLVSQGSNVFFINYLSDFPYKKVTNLWLNFRVTNKVYIVQTATGVTERCILMTTDPGDLVFDPTCGSGTTAYVAEQWGRRWITCDTSRVAITLAKQRLMTAVFDYYELAHPEEGVGSGFRYKTVPHVTLKSIANNEPPAQETLYDQPFVDKSRARVTGPFTVEAVPAPVVRPIAELTPSVSPPSEATHYPHLM